MASVVWQGIFITLCVEIAVVLLLCIPYFKWGFRKFLLKLDDNTKKHEDVYKYIHLTTLFILFGLVIAFVSSIQEVLKATERVSINFTLDNKTVLDVWEHSRVVTNKFRSERNMYLTGFALTLAVVINRFFQLFREEGKLRNEISGKSNGVDGVKKVK
mmetsp:Transcript_21612/g.37216  ORF Transcript_21612/g.37216 Transcript_21612/m.37216 type:complete len:158 (-) Transcript_21612:186-659(-)